MKKKNRETLFRHIENFPIFILSFHSNERHKHTLIFLADEKSLIVVAVHLLYVNGLHQAFALCYRRLFKSLTCTQFFHDAGLFIFSFELFQSSLDVLTFFYLYDYHCFIVFNCFLKLCFEITATNITGMETAPYTCIPGTVATRKCNSYVLYSFILKYLSVRKKQPPLY